MTRFATPCFWTQSGRSTVAGSGGPMKKTAVPWIAGAVVLGLSGCDLVSPEDRFFEEPTTFTRSLFETPEECAVWQEHGMNCMEFITFFPDGEAQFLLGGGDMLSGGPYRIRGRRIKVETDLRFLLSKDERTMLQEDRGAIWERDQE